MDANRVYLALDEAAPKELQRWLVAHQTAFDRVVGAFDTSMPLPYEVEVREALSTLKTDTNRTSVYVQAASEAFLVRLIAAHYESVANRVLKPAVLALVRTKTGQEQRRQLADDEVDLRRTGSGVGRRQRLTLTGVLRFARTIAKVMNKADAKARVTPEVMPMRLE